MAIIKISKADKLKGLPSTPGWHKIEILKAAIKPTKDNTGQNLILTYKIESTEKENDKYFFLGRADNPRTDALIPIMTAINGGVITKEAEELDTDLLVGKKCQVEIKTGTYNGTLKDEENGWLPYDAPTEGNGF